MDKLLQYLDDTDWFDPYEWPGFPAQRLSDKGTWRYQWLIQSALSALLTRTRFVDKRPDIEGFLLKDEIDCLVWAKRLNSGIHPDPPEPDPKTGVKLRLL